MVRNFYILLLLVFAIGCNNPVKKLQTPSEQANYKKLSMSADIYEFLNQCQQINPDLKLENAGTTAKGTPIYLVKYFSQSKTNKVKLFLFGQQHGNEPSGKEGLLLFIKSLTLGELNPYLKNVDVIIIPQTNPDGGDIDSRRNSNDIDLNRNHMILTANETRVIQQVFHKYQPEITVDFHEYYPYSKSWEEFGYRRNFDIQFGGLTNINVDSAIRNYFYTTVFNEVEEEVESNGYSFFEYTLGGFPYGERLRHSTVDVNDGRQSMGITNTLSFIVEGKRGRDSLHLLERRAKSQFHAALGVLKVASKHHNEIDQLVTSHRDKLKQNYADSVSIRLDHFKGKEPLHYPLISVETGEDTVFIVDEFHSKVKPLLKVKTPKGYLVPKSDTLLTAWLKRSNFSFTEKLPENSQVQAYVIDRVIIREDEGLDNFFAQVSKTKLEEINGNDYLFVPTLQIYQYKIVTALEPQAMYGLINYPEFEYLLKKNTFPVLRVE